MSQNNIYESLRFERRIPAIPRPWAGIGLALVIFTVAWLIIPAAALYWLSLPVVAALVWMAGYGWRQAVAGLIAYLRRLESIE